MKKVSTAVVTATKNFSQPKLTIGLDLGDRSSCYCVLDEAGEVLLEQKVKHDSESNSRGVWGHAALSDRAGDGDAFALGEPVAERTGARSNRGACAQRTADWRESEEGRSAGCADPGTIGED